MGLGRLPGARRSIVSRYNFLKWDGRTLTRTTGNDLRARECGYEVKRYKYQALVTLLPQDGHETQLPGPAQRMVVRAHHPEIDDSKMFSALVSADADTLRAGDPHVSVTMTVLGDDAGEYLSPCADFVLLRGHDVARGVIIRRIFV